MPEIKHHLTDALLMAYSAGTLPEAFDLVVATHVSMCDECRARMHAFDAVGGALIEDAGGIEMGADSLSATLAMIADRQQEPRRPAPVRRDRVFPAPLQDYVGGDLDAVKWRRVGGGVSDAILRTKGDATVRLLRIPGGVAVPDHGHRGLELTLVLQGAFRDDTDHFGAGDIEVAGDELVHQPIAERGPDCICLAATDAPLRFNALIPRLVQPFLRI
jgi:putative transcriptional regulator